jgi:hypothetical protein
MQHSQDQTQEVFQKLLKVPTCFDGLVKVGGVGQQQSFSQGIAQWQQG